MCARVVSSNSRDSAVPEEGRRLFVFCCSVVYFASFVIQVLFLWQIILVLCRRVTNRWFRFVGNIFATSPEYKGFNKEEKLGDFPVDARRPLDLDRTVADATLTSRLNLLLLSPRDKLLFTPVLCPVP